LLAAEIVKSRLEAVGVFVSLRTVQLDMRRLGLEAKGGPGESGCIRVNPGESKRGPGEAAACHAAGVTSA
jgi:hypothetical protein